MAPVFVRNRAVLFVAAACVLLLTVPALAHAEGIVVPASARVDHYLDDVARILYISNGTQVLRWDLSSRAFLTPLQPTGAGQLGGIDLSPDGRTLVVGDSAFDSSYRWIHLLDIATGTSRRVLIPDAGGEAGISSVAYGSDGRILITTHYDGSGWTPLRRYDPATDSLSMLTSSWGLSDGAVLAASADRSVIYWAETNNSSGPWGRYRVSDGTWVRRTGYTDGTSHFNIGVGVNADGSRVAMPTYFGTHVYDTSFSCLGVLGTSAGSQPAGVAYSPTKPLVFFPWIGTTKVRSYDTSTFTQVDEYDFGTTFSWPGNGYTYRSGYARTSASGRFLTVSVPGGVRYMAFNEPPSFAGNGSVTVTEDSGAYAEEWASSISPGSACEGSQTLTFTTTNSRNELFSQGPTISPDGTLHFTPAPDVTGSALVTVTLTDDAMDGGRPLSYVETMSISVTPVNDRPLAIDDALSVSEESMLGIQSLGLLLNDRDVDGDSLTFFLESLPQHGVLATSGVGAFTYRPDADFNGDDTFTYRVSDGVFLSVPATVTIHVVPVNDPPSFSLIASLTVNEDSGLYAGVAAAQMSAGPPNEQQQLTFTATNDAPDMFAVQPSVNASGILGFAPALDANGSVDVTVTLTDDDMCGGPARSAVATFVISVLPVDDPPVGFGDAATVDEDSALTVGAPGVLGNDRDPEGEALEASIAQEPAHGRVVLASDGSYTYQPDSDFNGEDTFTYVVSDESSRAIAPAEVRILVVPVNDSPVAMADWAQTGFQTTLTVAPPGVLSNDADVDSSSLLATIVGTPSHGLVELSADGGYMYVPDHGYTGTDSFKYRTSDGSLSSPPATVTVVVGARPSTRYEEVSGRNRFATCAEASKRAFPDGARTVVVATGRSWPDALGASALAGALDAPILLVDTHSIPASIGAELTRLHPTDAVIVGGRAAVGDEVLAALQQRFPGRVRRVAGPDRYATASAVASETIAALGEGYDGKAFVATGLSFPDALAASPLATALGRPIYLVRPDGAPFGMIADMRRQGVTSVVLLGGESALPRTIEDVLVIGLGPKAVSRVGGGNRYETAAAIASLGASAGLSYDGLAVATGEDFPDGLAGGVMQGHVGSVILLTPRASLAPSTSDTLRVRRDDIARLVYLGTTEAVRSSVREQIRRILD